MFTRQSSNISPYVMVRVNYLSPFFLINTDFYRTFILAVHIRNYCTLVGSVKVNFLSYRYRADKSAIFGMRGLWGLTINSGRGAMLKYL